MYFFTALAKEGGLIAYGVDLVALYRRVPDYIDRILKAQSRAIFHSNNRTRSTSAINLKSAKALGLTVPPTPARSRRRRGSNESKPLPLMGHISDERLASIPRRSVTKERRFRTRRRRRGPARQLARAPPLQELGDEEGELQPPGSH